MAEDYGTGGDEKESITDGPGANDPGTGRRSVLTVAGDTAGAGVPGSTVTAAMTTVTDGSVDTVLDRV